MCRFPTHLFLFYILLRISKLIHSVCFDKILTSVEYRNRPFCPAPGKASFLGAGGGVPRCRATRSPVPDKMPVVMPSEGGYNSLLGSFPEVIKIDTLYPFERHKTGRAECDLHPPSVTTPYRHLLLHFYARNMLNSFNYLRL